MKNRKSVFATDANGTVFFLTDKAVHKAMQTIALSRIRSNATYQRDVILGKQCVSGADLSRGAGFWGSYRYSRLIACEIWCGAGGHIRRNPADHGRLTLESCEPALDCGYSSCSVGGCYVY